MKLVRIAIGLAFWGVLAGVLWSALSHRGETAPAASQPMAQLWDYYTSGRRLELRLPGDCPLAAGDPVLAAEADGSLRQVGVVLRVSDNGQAAEAALFPSAPATATPQASYLSSPDSIAWVIQTLLPAERRQQVEKELATAMRQHQQEILTALEPVVENGVRDAFTVLREDLPRAIQHHQPQIEALAARYQSEILKDELIPLVKHEVWPIIRRDSESVVRQVGAELWERVSVWSFVWRGTLDKMPFVRGRDRVEMELQRFVDEEAVPILTRHQGDYEAVIVQIVRDVARDEKVQAGFRHSFARVTADPQLRQLLRDILQEAVVHNPRFWSALRHNLTSPEAQAALQLAGDRLEPTVRRIGDLVLGTREDGLTPEFNRVLRHQVLLKDRQGIILGAVPQTNPPLPCTGIKAWFSDAAP